MKFTPEVIAALQTLKDAAENDFEKKHIEVFIENLQNDKFAKEHLMAGSKIYNCWNRMKRRCLNPQNKDFDHYGGRGITVCEEWKDFQNFYEYVSKLPHFGEEGEKLIRPNIGHALISEKDAQEIRNLYATGKYLEKDIAEMYGIQQVTVSAIITNKTWKNQENKVEK